MVRRSGWLPGRDATGPGAPPEVAGPTTTALLSHRGPSEAPGNDAGGRVTFRRRSWGFAGVPFATTGAGTVAAVANLQHGITYGIPSLPERSQHPIET